MQFPDGLKKYALQYVHKLQADGHEVFLCACPCYGACDLAVNEAQAIHADELVHFGHAKFPIASPITIPVEYIVWKIDVDLENLKLTIPELSKYKRLALATNISHIHQLLAIKEFFKSNGIETLTKKGVLPVYEGQILGCDAFAIKIPEAEAILYIGDGMFHALTIEETKPVYIFNPLTKEFRQINDIIERLKKKRAGAIAAALSAKVFGILVSIKPGQFHLEVAKWAKRELEKIGKTAEIIVANEFNPYSIANFSVFEAYINTACPRIIDDIDLFGKPILNPDMLEEMINMICATK